MLKNQREIIGFDDRLFRLIGIPVIAFIIPLVFFNQNLAGGIWPYCHSWGEAILHTIIYWEGGRFIVIKVRQNFPEDRKVLVRVLVEIVLVTLYAFAAGFAIGTLLLGLQISSLPEQVSWSTGMVGALSVTYIVIGIYEAAYFYRKWRLALIEKEQFKQAATLAELEALKAQADPHFFFNSLNTLTYVIQEDPQRAIHFVQQLSKVYRYILDIRNRELVSLREEMEFLKAYTFLLKERFEENVSIQLDVPDQYMSSQVVPLSLQMLFENAIKHNVVSSAQPLHISLQVQQDKLVVENNLQTKKQVNGSNKIGLENIQKRYSFFTDKEITIRQDEQRFTVAIPLLEIRPPGVPSSVPTKH